MTNSIPYLKTILEWNAALMNLPLGALVVVACIAVGYLLKIWPGFENRWIPPAVVCAGVFFFTMTAERTADPVRVWLFKNIIFGLVCGALAWLIHNKVLKQLEARFGWFADNPDAGDKT